MQAPSISGFSWQRLPKRNPSKEADAGEGRRQRCAKADDVRLKVRRLPVQYPVPVRLICTAIVY